jgi:hypothetical protein
MPEHATEIRGTAVTVTVSQKSTRAWSASGKHLDQWVEAEGPTEIAALEAWRTRAAYLKPLTT